MRKIIRRLEKVTDTEIATLRRKITGVVAVSKSDTTASDEKSS
jgi:hypothetical protein